MHISFLPLLLLCWIVCLSHSVLTICHLPVKRSIKQKDVLEFCHPQTATLAVSPLFPPVLVLSLLTTGGSFILYKLVWKAWLSTFVLRSAPVTRTESHLPQHTGGLAGGSSHNRIYQRLLQRRTAQPVSMKPLPRNKSPKTKTSCRTYLNILSLSSSRCLVKITGDLTMSFPAGITRIFTANPNVPVLSFRLVNISRIDHFLPNQKLLYRSAALRVLNSICVIDCVRS